MPLPAVWNKPMLIFPATNSSSMLIESVDSARALAFWKAYNVPRAVERMGYEKEIASYENYDTFLPFPAPPTQSSSTDRTIESDGRTEPRPCSNLACQKDACLEELQQTMTTSNPFRSFMTLMLFCNKGKKSFSVVSVMLEI